MHVRIFITIGYCKVDSNGLKKELMLLQLVLNLGRGVLYRRNTLIQKTNEYGKITVTGQIIDFDNGRITTVAVQIRESEYVILEALNIGEREHQCCDHFFFIGRRLNRNNRVLVLLTRSECDNGKEKEDQLFHGSCKVASFFGLLPMKCLRG